LIEHVTRQDDPRLESYRHVGDPRWLEDNGLFVAEGRLVVARLLTAALEIESILVTPPAARVMAFPPAADYPVYVASQEILEQISGIDFHRGCLAIAKRPVDPPLDSFAASRRLVVLEGVGNPDNIGGIFRSAAAFGADGVLLDETAGDPLYRKAIRTSMGAVLRLPFARARPWPGHLRQLRKSGVLVVALSPAARLTLEAFASTLSQESRLAILAGAEGPGLSDAAIAEADITVRIPIDPRSDSLNVVVAVSIVLERLRGERS
jgi:tRNA G18 (ribose-2'-O)-methylase SpoU